MIALPVCGVSGDHEEILGTLGKAGDNRGVPDRDVNRVGVKPAGRPVEKVIAENALLGIGIPSCGDNRGRGAPAERAERKERGEAPGKKS